MARTLHPRFTEMGRIRIGDQIEEESKGRPGAMIRRARKLDTFRMTSINKIALDQLAILYGGTPERWREAPHEGTWQLYTESNCLDVVFPSLRALSVLYEIWGNGFCKLRCDGERILFNASENPRVGDPCQCPDDDEVAANGGNLADTTLRCPIIARISVTLGGIEGLGTWRLDTHGYYAASELKGIVSQLRAIGLEHAPLACYLRLEQRSVVRLQNTGRNKGKPGTQKFVVPVLAPKYSYQQLQALGQRPTPMLSAPVADSVDGIRQAGERAAAELFGGDDPLPDNEVDSYTSAAVLIDSINQAMAETGMDSERRDRYWAKILQSAHVDSPANLPYATLARMMVAVRTWPKSKELFAGSNLLPPVEEISQGEAEEKNALLRSVVHVPDLGDVEDPENDIPF